jgi:hypothetical protein
VNAQAEAKFHMYYLFCTDDLMKPHGSILVVTMWCGMCTDPVLRCFDNPEGLNCSDLLIGVDPEFSSWLTV